MERARRWLLKNNPAKRHESRKKAIRTLRRAQKPRNSALHQGSNPVPRKNQNRDISLGTKKKYPTKKFMGRKPIFGPARDLEL